MTEWKRRPTVSPAHPFKELYDKILDMNRDQLLLTIKNDIDNYFKCKELEKEGNKSLENFFLKKWHENTIETYFWKFINKDTRVVEKEEDE